MWRSLKKDVIPLRVSLPQLLSIQLTTYISKKYTYVFLKSPVFEDVDLMNNRLYRRHFQVKSQPFGSSTVVVCCQLSFLYLSGFILKFKKKTNTSKEAAEQ
jgi:hypothetical protein